MGHPRFLEFPLEKGGSYGEAGAYAGQEDQVSLFQAALVEGGLHGEGDGGGGGVAVTVDVDDDAAFIHAETLGGGQNDALVGLVRDEAGEVFAGDAVAGEDGLGGFGHLAHGKLVDCRAVLVDVVLLGGDGLCGCGMQ